MAWDQEEGYRSFSLDDRPPSDTQLLEQHGQLPALHENNEPYDAVNFLLNQDIEAGGLLKLYSHSALPSLTQSTLALENSRPKNLYTIILAKNHYENQEHTIAATSFLFASQSKPQQVNAIMCCCWPVEDVYVEENRAENRPREFVWNGSRWVEVVGRRCAVSIVFILSFYCAKMHLQILAKFWPVIPSNGDCVGLGKTGEQTVRDTIPLGETNTLRIPRWLELCGLDQPFSTFIPALLVLVHSFFLFSTPRLDNSQDQTLDKDFGIVKFGSSLAFEEGTFSIRSFASPRLSYSITITRITMGGVTRSSDQKEPKSSLKQSPSPHVHFSTSSNKHRNHSRDTTRETTHSTEIPVNQPSATASGNQNNNTSTAAAPATTTTANSAYQTPGPGFDHIVTNVPGVGLVYNQTPINGSNPASGQQPHLQHQGPGLARPQVLPPGFVQAPTSPFPQFFPPVSHLSNPAMAYTSFMPNQGQHFQPPVPDTTYGAIPHTYTPRFDNPVPNGQYLTINGQIYRVVVNQTVQDGAAGGTPVQLVPLQQVSTIHTQGPSSVPPTFQTIPCYVVHQASSQPAYYPVNASLIRTLSEAPGVANAPILLQQGAQQGVFIPAQTGLPGIAAPAPVAVQPGAFPAMVGQPQVLGAANMPGAWPAAAAPDVMGIGKTSTEIQMEQYHTALNTKALEGQDIAPADPDPSRMYYCRELDGEWTLRNRYGIDNMGDCRWYVMPGGVFYAVRITTRRRYEPLLCDAFLLREVLVTDTVSLHHCFIAIKAIAKIE
ncbi:hypothetical protein M434DRAFT_31085 [Hypoxylon sp. CO27-5]|nr:hypothetical protein M434DRAFT_31085 [Hypoxylon sp. CO27-5]